MTAEQHGSTTDRITELGLAIDQGESSGAEHDEEGRAKLAELRAELPRLRNEPISVEERVAEINAAIKQVMDGALDALTNEEYIIIHNLQTERSRLQSAAPSPPSVEAGRGEREDSLAVLPKRLRGSERYDLAHARQTLERVTVPPAEELAALQGNGEAVASDDDVAEIERLAQSHSVLHWPTLLRVIDRLRKAEANAAPPSNPDGVREALEKAAEIARKQADDWEAQTHVNKPSYQAACQDIYTAIRKAALTTLPSRTGLEEAAEWPAARGVSRDADSEQALVVHFDRRLTDDEMRNVHDALRTRAATTTA